MLRIYGLLLSLLMAQAALAEELIKFDTDQVEINMVIRDGTTGALKSDVTFASAGLQISWRCDKGAITSYSGANIQDITSISTYVAPSAGSVRFKAMGAVIPGAYVLWPEDTVFSGSSCRTITFGIIGTGIVADPLKVILTDNLPGVDVLAMSGTTPQLSANPGTGNAITFATMIRANFQRFFHRFTDDGKEQAGYQADGTTKVFEANVKDQAGVYNRDANKVPD